MKTSDRISFETIDTTIGELVEIISEIALEAGKTEEEGYRLAALTIESILRRQKAQRTRPAIN